MKNLFIKYAIIFIVALSSCSIKSDDILRNYAVERSFLERKGLAPDLYLLEKFKKYDVVILGEDHAIKDNLDFVAELIPKLYEHGITNLGMEFGSFELQASLDSLLTAPAYDTQFVRDMMFYYNVGWAYQEYMNIYLKAWEFNQTLPEGGAPFRVLNLSYRYNWEAYDGGTTVEEMPDVFYRGNPNTTRYQVVRDQVISKDEKALLLVGIPHAFTRYSESNLTGTGDCEFSRGSLGNMILDHHPEKVFSVLLHAPFWSLQNNEMRYVSPGNGVVDDIMKLNSYQPIGFDVMDSPIGKFSDQSSFSVCNDDLRLSDLFDGYIFLTPFNEMQNCSIDEKFFDGKAWTEIKTNIPDPYWHDPVNSLEEYWAQIRLYANVKSRYQTLFENPAQTPEYGKVVQVPNFKSQHVVSRNVDVWLPPNYNEDNAYPVIYMHDGQMLFDGASTWNGQEWNIDEVVTHLMMENKIPPVIIVGVWNTGRTRHSEYYPQKPLKLLPTSLRDTLVSRNLAGKPQADQYLNFLVKELKPEIDQKFATLTKAEDTYIMGSSMGGLISMYAMCEYPDVFGGAGCLSTHWVGDPNIQGTEIIKSFAQYLDENLPTANDHKFYFDHGTVGLDGLYEPGQAMVDKIMQSHGFDDMSWMTKKFEGADHSEKSWNERLHIPLQFLLKK